MKKNIMYTISVGIAVILFSGVYFFSCTERRLVTKSVEQQNIPEWQRKEIEKRDREWKSQRKKNIREYLEIDGINFYGKVIDQNDEPVSDAIVKFEIYNPRNKRDLEEKIVTDASGYFTISGYNGQRLHITSINHDEYSLNKKKKYLGIYDFTGKTKKKYYPDKKRPETFKMWKYGETEPLLKTRINKRIVPNGQPNYIDIINHTVSLEFLKNVDLIIELQAEDQAEHHRFNWDVVLKTIDGGILETKDQFMYKAPEEGYQETIEINFDKTEKFWKSDITKKIYLKSRNGKLYAALNCRIKLYTNKRGRIIIESIINPNGSTNLEYDPKKRILP